MQYFTHPTSGPTVQGDEFLNQTTGMWHDVPPESIGQEIDGVVVRRPVPDPDPVDVSAELWKVIEEIDQTVRQLGQLTETVREGTRPKPIGNGERDNAAS